MSALYQLLIAFYWKLAKFFSGCCMWWLENMDSTEMPTIFEATYQHFFMLEQETITKYELYSYLNDETFEVSTKYKKVKLQRWQLYPKVRMQHSIFHPRTRFENRNTGIRTDGWDEWLLYSEGDWYYPSKEVLPDPTASGRSIRPALNERKVISKQNKKSNKTKKQNKIIHKRKEQQDNIEILIARYVAQINKAEELSPHVIFEKEYGSNIDTLLCRHQDILTAYGCKNGFKTGVKIYLKNIYEADIALCSLKEISSGTVHIIPLRLTKNKTKFFYGKHRLHLDRCIFFLHLRELQEKRWKRSVSCTKK